MQTIIKPTNNCDYYLDSKGKGKVKVPPHARNIVVDTECGAVRKWIDHGVHVFIPETRANMEADDKIFGIHWETEQDLPLWQLTQSNWLRVNVTGHFGAKFRLTAYRPLSEEDALALRKRMSDTESGRSGHRTTSKIDSWKMGNGSRVGNKRDIFKYTPSPSKGGGSMWKVTNNSLVCPGLKVRWQEPYMKTLVQGSDFHDSLVRHPNDPYQVQFSGVPWNIFTRYWRKPINLDRKFHSNSKWSRRLRKGVAAQLPAPGAPALEVLDFDMEMLKKHKCFFADFSTMYQTKTRTHDADMAVWMLKNARAFKILSDDDSPFDKQEAETYFTMDWML